MGRRLLPVSIAAAVLVLAAAGSAQPPQWTNTGPEGGGVYSLATSPAAPDTVYAGTSDGVYKSTDFGTTWRRSSNGLPDTFGAVAVDPQDVRRVYAHAKGGVWRSVDGGRHWQLPAKAPKEMWGVVQIAVAPSAPKTLYALTGGWATPAIWRSTNRGMSWRRVPGAPPMTLLDLAVDPRSPDQLYLGAIMNVYEEKLVPGGVYVSTDGGRTWRRRVTSDVGIHALVVDPVSATVYAGGGDGEIYRSADRGAHWRMLARLDVRDRIVALAVDPRDPDVVYALTLEGVHRSTDRGVSWRLVGKRSFGLTRGYSWASHFATMIVHPQSDRILLSSGDSGVLRSDDHGRSWTADSSGRVATTISALAAHPKNPLVAYAVAGGQLWVTRDGGRTWRALSEVADAWGLALDPQRPTTIYAVTHREVIRKSTDGGRTWRSVLRGASGPVVVDPARPSTVYAGARGGVFKSTDDGMTWRRANSGLGSADNMWGLAIDPVRTSTLYAILAAEGPTSTSLRIFKTINGAATWEDLGVSHDAGSGWIAVDRKGTVYVKGLRSDDGGATWTETSLHARLSAIDLAHPGVVYAGDYDGAVYMTRNSGATLQEAARLRWPVGELAVGAGASRLYVGTLGHGVFVARLPLAP